MASLGGLQMVHLAWLGISGTYSSGSLNLAWPPGGCMGSSWGKMSLLTCFVVVATKNEWRSLEWVSLESSATLHAGNLVDLVVKIIWRRGGEELIQTWCGSVGLWYQS